MAEISAKMVYELRAKTGVGVMDCKKALKETDGNFDEAIKYLREKGIAVAAKKQDRIAAEGVVDILRDGETAVMIEVNAETDFVAKNASFQEFVAGLLRTILANKPADIDALMACNFDGTDLSVDQSLKDKIFTIVKRSPFAASSSLTAYSPPTFTARARPALSLSSRLTTLPRMQKALLNTQRT